MVQVCTESVECKVSVVRMWHGLFKDAHNCLPKALPHHVLGVEYPHGQEGFHLPGHERLIKLQKGLGGHLVAAFCEEVHEVEKHVKDEETLIKEKVVKVDKELHKQEDLLKEKAEEAVHGAEKEAKEKVEEVGKGVHEAGKEVKEKVEEVGKGVHEVKEEVHKEVHVAEKKVVGGAHEVAKITEKVLHEEAKVAHKAASVVDEVLHKEEELVGGAFNKVDAFIKQEELWIKEKIEEVDEKLFKITISVLAGGLIGVLFKHCKHTFELKDTKPHGSILHWTSEFETLSSALHYHHAFEKLEQHALAPFRSVEAYLLKHDDYAH